MEVFNINHSVSGCRVSSKLAFFSRLIMLYRFLKWRPLRRNFTFGFGLADSLQKIRVYQQTKFRSYSSIYVWVITTSDLEKNKHPPYWNSTSSFDFDHITILGMSLHSELSCQSSSKSVHLLRRYDVISIFKMAAAAAQFYFRFPIGWRRSL